MWFYQEVDETEANNVPFEMVGTTSINHSTYLNLHLHPYIFNTYNLYVGIYIPYVNNNNNNNNNTADCNILRYSSLKYK